MLLAFLAAAAGCTANVAPPARSARAVKATPQEVSESTPLEPAPRAPAETLALADRLYESRLGASRGQFDEDRQIAVLEEEVLLYTQFLERATGEPELEPAVRKSRERIADANATIEFLRKRPHRDGAEPPLAPTE